VASARSWSRPPQARAAELAAAARREGYTQSGAFARVVLVPLLASPLLDAVALDEQTLAEELAGAARASRLVPHSLGITTRASAAGVTLEVGERHSANAYTLSVGRNGEIVAEASVTGTDTFGSMRVVPDRVREAVEGAIAFAERAWQRTDPRGEVQEAAAAIAIPHAEHRSWGRDHGGSSISMAGSFRMPEIALAPQPALVVRRADLARGETITRLVAEIRRVFVDAGAVDEG
jgi:hypothetical protein